MSGVPCRGNGDGHEHGFLDALTISFRGQTETPLREEWGFVFLQIYAILRLIWLAMNFQSL